MTKEQQEFLSWEFGLFFHFGIRSFYPGHKDWDGKPMPISGFNPKELDCRQWTRTAREAGARYAIMTTKHHDGFALWPTKYSTYSVQASPWKNGQGDVVKEFTDACRAEGLKVGLYYSPAQWGEGAVAFQNEKEYDDYFIAQITELLTGYGKIDYLFFDGCGSAGHEYDRERILAEMKRLQPEMMTFSDPEWRPTVLWAGNEDGYASLDLPADKAYECDCRIRSTWFYDLNEDTLKSPDELWGMYEGSVGRGANFLLNIGPDNRGLLPEADVARLLELGEKIRRVYGKPLELPVLSGGKADASSASAAAVADLLWAKPLERATLVNRIVLCEDLSAPSRITSVKVRLTLPRPKFNILVYEGHKVGHKLIIPIPAVPATGIMVEVEGGRLAELKGYYCG